MDKNLFANVKNWPIDCSHLPKKSSDKNFNFYAV